MGRLLFVSLGHVCLALVLSTGCSSREELNTEYGQLQSSGRTASLNGTRLFAEMFRQAGAQVNRFTEINPRLEKYETIVWFPDSAAAPEETVIDALEEWATNGYSRTLIYVGRSYTAELDYLERVRNRGDADPPEELLRQIAEARTRRQTYQNRNFLWTVMQSDQCRWFLTQRINRGTSSRVTGWLAEETGLEECELDIGTVLVPPEDSEGDDPENHLLYADDRLFAWQIPLGEYAWQTPQGDYGYGNNHVIVVSNASFLLNYSLTDSGHVQLAEELITMCDTSSPVAFLESGQWGLRIRESEVQHHPWSWISQRPLRYVVPHILFWGIMLCFALFPVFGRARRFRVKQSFDERSEESFHRQVSTTSFRSHIVAMGKLLQRCESREEAEAKIRKYRESN